MSEDRIDDLIKRLKNLQIQERQLNQQLKHVQEEQEQIVLRLSTLRAKEKKTSQKTPRTADSNQTSTFEIGNQVQIINNILQPFNIMANLDNRRGIVTRVSNPWVYLTTNNRFETKKYSKNLRKL